ncbi:MAG: DUF1624 domain-containing protein [Sandaracinaceae bacterium]|nr:DUF1624 domain-containing protein [Sandaracinaceae bacterium]
MGRLAALDRLRGIVMVLMVLDHARDFYFGVHVHPMDPAQTTPILAATRWVTHFCAPAFVLLAGASAYLYGRKRSARERAVFLVTRGLWLVVLEITVVKIGWAPEPFYYFTLLQVIWAIGWSMVLIAPLSMLPPRLLAALGAIMIASHNLLDSVRFDGSFLWSVIHQRQVFEPLEGHFVSVGYPLVPWIGVMMLGFGAGELFAKGRTRSFLWIGVALTVAFAIVRGLNGYGDPEPWSVQPHAWQTVVSFLDCEKYPPSLAYLLMTLGLIAIALYALDRHASSGTHSGEQSEAQSGTQSGAQSGAQSEAQSTVQLGVRSGARSGTQSSTPAGALARALETIGRVPLFFYVAHLWLLRFTSLGFAFARWGMGAIRMPPEGHAGSPEWPLWATYLAWATTIAILYPACRWYAALKERRSAQWWWLRYL